MVNAGAMLVAAANELVFLFVGLELVSMPTYLLLYLSRRNRATQEAATKYFFLSIFSSGLLLYGLAFLYGTMGISNLKAIGFLFDKLANVPQPQLGLIAVVFVMAGLCFRVAAVPLHFYAPDVYQGSPIVIAAVLAWVPKAVGFLAIVRTLTAVFAAKDAGDPLVQKAVMLSWVIAAATMIWGNFVALLQENLKRLLAYSSIAHAGYMMVGVTAAFANDRSGGGVVLRVRERLFLPGRLRPHDPGGLRRIHGRCGSRTGRWRRSTTSPGLGWTHPWSALALSICLLEPDRHSAAGRLLGKVRDLRARCWPPAQRGESGSLRRAGGHRHAERGRRSVLLPADRRRDVFRQAQGADRDRRRLAGRRGRERLCGPDGLLRDQFSAVVEPGPRGGGSRPGSSAA